MLKPPQAQVNRYAQDDEAVAEREKEQNEYAPEPWPISRGV